LKLAYLTYSIILVVLVENCFAQNSLQYPSNIFNSDTCCWRTLSAEGKYREAANLIIHYKRQNTNVNKHSLNWHAGQLFAKAGDTKQAEKYMKKTYSVLYKWFGGSDGAQWYYFAKGTLAFVERRKNRMERIISKWQRKYEQDGNYHELIKLHSNWDKPYAEAYK
jgi:hypothetical protein